MASKPRAGPGVEVLVSVAYVARSIYYACMHDRPRSNRVQFLPILEEANVTIDLNGRTTSCDGMQRARLKRTTSQLVPHLGGVAASVGAFNRAGVYTLPRACANAL